MQETKEQIAGLETKLASLKEEKHQLFLTLKKVLNEDDVRRKKESSELSSLYPQNSHPNVLPLSGHIVQPPGSSRYIQPGQSGSGEARGRSAYMKPPGGSSYHSSQQHFPYLPPLITTTATGRVKTCRVRDSHKDTVIGGQAQKESIMGGITILRSPAPVIDPFPAWKPPFLMP